MTALARQIGLGRLVYGLYHRPKAAIRALSQRGFVSSAVDSWHHRAMRNAAMSLPAPFDPQAPTIHVHYLTGERFWHQTVFCAWSLAMQGRVNVVPELYDDGTLDAEAVSLVKRVFPAVVVHAGPDTESRLDSVLPRDRFPILRSRRDEYPNLKKVLDVHAGRTGWKLVLDSDMLFFRPPVQLLKWLEAPSTPCHMVDSETSYGYPLPYLSEQCGAKVEERVNVGITGLKSEEIPWDDLERWAARQCAELGSHYFQEQALIAQLVAGKSPTVLAEEDYVCLPNANEGREPKSVMHHYVASSKPVYYRWGWRNAIARSVR